MVAALPTKWRWPASRSGVFPTRRRFCGNVSDGRDIVQVFEQLVELVHPYWRHVGNCEELWVGELST